MSYENFIHHRDQQAMARGQAQRDAAMPTEEHLCGENCPDCAGSGFQPGGQVECLRCRGDGKLKLHLWRRLPHSAKDGTQFKRCKSCGEIEEI